MAIIADFFTRKKRDVQKIIDTTFFRLMESTAPIDGIMPIKDYMSRKLLLMRFKRHKPTIASVIAEGQDVPATRPRAELDENLFNNLKAGKKYLFTAREFELMQEMENYLAGAGPMAAQMATELEKHFFGVAEDLPACVIELATVLAFQVATTGSCTYVDPLTEAEVELTYPGLIAAHLPAPLTAGARWSQPTTCTPLTGLEQHARAYYDNLGFFPPTMVLHWSNLRQVADSTEAKRAVMRKLGADAAEPTTTELYIRDEQAIDLIKERTRANNVILFDAMYSEEQKNGDPIDRYFLPEDTYFFGAEGQFERAFVPTVEKRFAAGLYFEAKEIKSAPLEEHALAMGNMIPFCADPRRIAARKVA